jgi:type II secretory pathway component GspD/PulD (secretin)
MKKIKKMVYMKVFKFILLIFSLIALVPMSMAGSKTVRPRLISISVKQSDVSELFEMLSRQNKINIVLANEVAGKVSINLYDVSVKQAVYAIASAADLTVERMGRGYLISTKGNAGKTIAGGLTDFRTYKVQYSDANKVSEILEKHLSQYGNIDILQERNLLVIEDLPDFLNRIEKLLYQLDQAPAQILIEAKILSITLDDEQKYGINWTKGYTGAGGKGTVGGNNLGDQVLDLAIGAGGGPAGMFFNYFSKNIEVQLNLLSKKDRVRTLSSPRLLALEHQEAEVIIGDRKGYSVTTTINQVTTESVQFLESGVILRVTPSIDHFGRVMLDIHPEVSIGTVNPDTGIPDQTTTEVTTRVLVEDGETIFIGGLIGTSVSNDHQGVPILEDIPLLGYLFASENPRATNTETIVMIKPQIIRHNNYQLLTEPRDRVKKFEESRKKEIKIVDDFFEESFIHRSE